MASRISDKSSANSVIPRKRPAETQEEAWVADEDRFVLRQAKKKALLRVRSQRAQPIDYLAVTLRSVDNGNGVFESDDEDSTTPVVNPETVFEKLDHDDLKELESGIDTYLALEKSRTNREYWQVMKLVCKDRRELGDSRGASSARGIDSVAAELDKVLAPKTLTQLEALERQIRAKLRSDDDIDVDYWENLLTRLKVHEARQKLRRVSQQVIDARWSQMRKEQQDEAARMRQRAEHRLAHANVSTTGTARATHTVDVAALDPPPMLKLPKELASYVREDGHDFQRKLLESRQKVAKAGYIEAPKTLSGHVAQAGAVGETKSGAGGSAYDRELAKGVAEDEEVFNVEETLEGSKMATPSWSGQYTARKPQHFNRVQTGYEWNKYNQTHYDHDNPPPKVVQGYKFNIFYPDLIDKTKAPTYRIERENGRKRGQTSAPAGEDDTCVLRFIAGPPYEDIAFRIIDKEWDYSAKYERGFRSRFDKGILQLHFQFKKVYYRK